MLSEETTYSEPYFLFNKSFMETLVEEDGGFTLPESIFIFFLIGEETGDIKASEDRGFTVESILDSEGEGESGTTTSSMTTYESVNRYLCKRSSRVTSQPTTVSTSFLPSLFQRGLKSAMPRVTSSESAHLT